MRNLRIKLAIGALVAPIALLAACSTDREAETPSVLASSDNTDADNSARNANDEGALSPTDQGRSESDRTVTQMVRQSVVDQDGFSVNAKNVKIITQDGVVTLRGPVATQEEKTQIALLSARADGVKSVVNQLEVETNP